MVKRKVGERVKFREDILRIHAQSVSEDMRYEFAWRDTLRKLKGKTGVITRVVPFKGKGGDIINVEFGKGLKFGIREQNLVGVKKKKLKKVM